MLLNNSVFTVIVRDAKSANLYQRDGMEERDW